MFNLDAEHSNESSKCRRLSDTDTPKQSGNGRGMSMYEASKMSPTVTTTSQSPLNNGGVDGRCSSGSWSGSEDDYRIGSGVTLPTRTYSCKMCGQSTTSSRQHLRHQKEEHNMDYMIYECDLCDYATQYKQKLPRHRKCHFNESGPDSPAAVASPQTSIGYNFNSNSMVSILRKPEELPAKSLPLSMWPSGQHVPSDISHMSSMYENNSNIGAMANNRMLFGQPQGMWDPKLLQKTEDARKVVKKSPVVREAVDPAKYLTIQEEDGMKFACSKCGNKYKWRKSLNKHWKEKHEGETPPGANSRFTMLNVPSVKNNVLQSEKNTYSIASSAHQTSPASVYKQHEANTPDQVLNTLKQMAPSLPYPYDLTRNQIAAAYHTNLSQYLSLFSSPPKAHGAAMYYPHLAALQQQQQNHINAYNTAIYQQPLKAEPDNVEGILDLSMKDKSPSPSISETNRSSPGITQDEPLDFSMKLEDKAHTAQPVAKSNDETDCSDNTEINHRRCFLCLNDFTTYDVLNEHFIEKHMATINDQIQNDLLDDIGIEREVDARKFEYLCQYLVRGHISEEITCIVCGLSDTKDEVGAHLYECHSILSNGVEITTPRSRTPEDNDTDDDSMTCNQCGFRARSHAEEERHTLVHLLNRSHACFKCGFSTQHEVDLQV